MVINTYAPEGGRQSSQFSLDDPYASAKQDYLAGRLRFTQGAGNYPDLATQMQQQGLNNLYGGSPLQVRPSVSDKPDITPFPVGCPVNFYQSGNVCIPIVGTYPDGTTYAPAAGHEYPKAVIQQAVPPSQTTRGSEFYMQVFFTNTGSVRGKFFLRLKVGAISIDVESTGVWIPPNSNGLLYIKVVMPTGAPSSSSFPAVVEISHLDENQSSSTLGQHVVDDSDNVNIPGPSGAGTTPCTPPTAGCPAGTAWNSATCLCESTGGGGGSGDPSQCFSMTLPQLLQYAQQYPSAISINNPSAIVAFLLQQGLPTNTTVISFCQSATQAFNAGCVKTITSGGSKVYCPTISSAPPPSTTAVITLSPSGSIPDGQNLTVVGVGFQAGEPVIMQVVTTTHSLQASTASWENKVFTTTVTMTASSSGAFSKVVQMVSFGSGITGHAIITAVGQISHRQAVKDISIT